MTPQRSGDSGPASSLELLWGTRERPSRGPKPGLSLEAIVSTAITVADKEGLEAVSMQRVATDLGYTTMSLYRYVPSKDQLVEVMRDTAFGEAPSMEGVDDWRAQLELWTRTLWARYLRHPWTLRIQISGPPLGPNALTWFESGIRGLLTAGLTGAEAMSACMFMDGAVRDLARISDDLARARHQAGVTDSQAEASYARALAHYADASHYPTLAGLVASGIFEPADGSGDAVDLDLEFGVQRVLDGIETFVSARAR